MLIVRILDRIDENHEFVCGIPSTPAVGVLGLKLRATAEPKAHKKVKHQLAAAAAQIGILP